MDSLTFLKAFHPGGPWILTAIWVDRKKIETKTFKQPATVKKWLDKYNGKVNIYFSVNVPDKALSKKAARRDIAFVPWLHVDVDARAGEPLDKELIRIRTLLEENCPVAKPTVVIYSGGGYQAFWKLAEPVATNCELEKAQEVALYNKQLEIIFDGDNCHNIDRIMRLPGTINIPDAKKVAKGRIAVEAEVHWFETDLVYKLTDFEQAPAIQMDSSTQPANAAPLVNTANIARLGSVDELDKWKVSDRVKIIIVQGEDPDNPKPDDNSRSSWLFDVICQLARCDVPDEVIYSIVTDPDFGISGSVLDKAPNSEKYATRQIQRAREEVEEPWLRKLNERFAVIGNLGGRCRIVEEVYNTTLKRSSLTKQTFQDFKNRYSNHTIAVGKKEVPVGQWWTTHTKRRQFEHLIFDPGNDDPEVYNLWQGFGCRSLPGDKHTGLLSHMLNNICSGNKDYYTYLIKWMARAVQKPNTPGETAVVLRGESGVGKGFMVQAFGQIWGRHFLQVSNAKHLVGAFNAHLRDCVVLFGDEAFFAGDRSHESTLKTLITENLMMVESKGIDTETCANYVHLLLASNSRWIVPTGPTERRYFVLDVSNKKKQDSAYFNKIKKELRGGGYENLLHFLLNLDLTGFDVRTAPHTKALMEQKIHSLDPMESWWLSCLQDGVLNRMHGEWKQEVACSDVANGYIETCSQFNVQRRGSAIQLGLFLDVQCPGIFPVRVRLAQQGTRQYFYRFPSLTECRHKWEDTYGGDGGWGSETPAEKEAAVQQLIEEEQDLPF